MKRIIIISILAVLALGCGSKDRLRAFIPGTYVGHFETDYSRGNDTLFINPLSYKGNSYSIIRKVTYSHLRKGKGIDTEHKTDNWVGVYNPQTGVVYENSEGTVYSFAPDKNILYRGNQVYHKLDE